MRLERLRQADLAAEIDALNQRQSDAPESFLVQMKTIGSYPTASDRTYACSPVSVSGPETEGAAATFVADLTVTLFAVNTGTAVPPIGTKCIARNTGGRLCFAFNG